MAEETEDFFGEPITTVAAVKKPVPAKPSTPATKNPETKKAKVEDVSEKKTSSSKISSALSGMKEPTPSSQPKSSPKKEEPAKVVEPKPSKTNGVKKPVVQEVTEISEEDEKDENEDWVDVGGEEEEEEEPEEEEGGEAEKGDEPEEGEAEEGEGEDLKASEEEDETEGAKEEEIASENEAEAPPAKKARPSKAAVITVEADHDYYINTPRLSGHDPSIIEVYAKTNGEEEPDTFIPYANFVDLMKLACITKTPMPPYKKFTYTNVIPNHGKSGKKVRKCIYRYTAVDWLKDNKSNLTSERYGIKDKFINDLIDRLSAPVTDIHTYDPKKIPKKGQRSRSNKEDSKKETSEGTRKIDLNGPTGIGSLVINTSDMNEDMILDIVSYVAGIKRKRT
jgi:hypothetical protein